MTRYLLERRAGRLAVNTFGESLSQATPLLLIHPTNLRGSSWLRVVSELSADRFCVVPDLRGFGDSSTSDRYDVSLWAQDCLDAASAAGIDEFHAVGASLGGTVAAYLAATVPQRVASVLAFGSQLYSEDPDGANVLAALDSMSVAEMFNEIIPRYSMAPGVDRRVVDEALSTTNSNGPDDIRAVWAAAAAADIRPLAPNVACHVTVATGAHDTTCPPHAGRQMAESLGGEFSLIEGCGHLPMFEMPTELVRLTIAHLARAEGGAR